MPTKLRVSQLGEIQSVLPMVTDTEVLPQEPLTPVEKHGEIWYKRDDTYEFAGQYGGKVRTCRHIVEKNLAAIMSRDVARCGLVTAGSRQSPQVNIVAHVAKHFGLPCRVHVPGGALSPELLAAQEAGAHVIQHYPGHNSVIVSRAQDDARSSHYVEIPFGMTCREAVHMTATQVENLPREAKRLVVPVGSGMTLAGVLEGMLRFGITMPVLGVIVGADPTDRLTTHSLGWQQRVRLVKSPLNYHQAYPDPQAPDGGPLLDPIYEAKCLPFLEPGDVLWCVGIRQTSNPDLRYEAEGPRLRSTPGMHHWEISANWAKHHLNCTLDGIKSVCGGMCCKSQTFWPPASGHRLGHDGCVHLGPNGCQLGADRPVTCHMYPLKVNSAGKWVMHHRITQGPRHMHCGANYDAGPMIIEAIYPSLVTLFGKAQADGAVEDVKNGINPILSVPPSVAAALEREEKWALENVPPEPRSAYDDGDAPAAQITVSLVRPPAPRSTAAVQTTTGS